MTIFYTNPRLTALAVLFVLLSYATAVPQATTSILRSLGGKEYTVQPRRTRGSGSAGNRSGRTIRIRYADLSAIRDACPSVDGLAPAFSPGRGQPVHIGRDRLGIPHGANPVAHVVDGKHHHVGTLGRKAEAAQQDEPSPSAQERLHTIRSSRRTVTQKSTADLRVRTQALRHRVSIRSAGCST